MMIQDNIPGSVFTTGSIFNGVTSYTKAEAILAGFDVEDKEI